VSWRTREIGLRLALGANRVQIAKLVLGQSLMLALAGSVVGIAASAAVMRLLSQFLFETSPLDPVTYTAVPLLFCVLALIAAWAPARRAAAVDQWSRSATTSPGGAANPDSGSFRNSVRYFGASSSALRMSSTCCLSSSGGGGWCA